MTVDCQCSLVAWEAVMPLAGFRWAMLVRWTEVSEALTFRLFKASKWTILDSCNNLLSRNSYFLLTLIYTHKSLIRVPKLHMPKIDKRMSKLLKNSAWMQILPPHYSHWVCSLFHQVFCNCCTVCYTTVWLINLLTLCFCCWN